MSADYVVLAVVALLGLSGGLYLLGQAKKLRRDPKDHGKKVTRHAH